MKPTFGVPGSSSYSRSPSGKFYVAVYEFLDGLVFFIQLLRFF